MLGLMHLMSWELIWARPTGVRCVCEGGGRFFEHVDETVEGCLLYLFGWFEFD